MGKRGQAGDAFLSAALTSQSEGFKARNPHLFAKAAPQAAAPAPGSPPRPAQGKRGIRTAPKPKTRPEREMWMILEAQKRRGDVAEVVFEGMTIEVGDGTTYKPDFVVWLHDGRLRFVEVKGPHIREDSLVKWKCAKGRFPLAEWQLHQLIKGEWTRIA